MNAINTKHVVLYGGTETTAPMALVSGGEVAPSWAGKTLRELDNAQFDAMFAFALADGRAKGFEAGTKHRRVSGNPFHKRAICILRLETDNFQSNSPDSASSTKVGM